MRTFLPALRRLVPYGPVFRWAGLAAACCLAATSACAPRGRRLPPPLPAEHARVQARHDARLQRLEARLVTMDAQLGVLREQLRGARAAAAAELPARTGANPRRTAVPRVLRLHGSQQDALTPWPQDQRIVTDKAGRVRLVNVPAATGAIQAPPRVATSAPLGAPGAAASGAAPGAASVAPSGTARADADPPAGRASPPRTRRRSP